MKKMFFEEPEMEVVRFDARDIFTATSGEPAEVDSQEEEVEEEEILED